MKKVISFSGGRTSGYAVNLFKNDPDAYFIFMDTGAEHPATYQFIKDIVKHWKINLVCLRVVVNPQMKRVWATKLYPLMSSNKTWNLGEICSKSMEVLITICRFVQLV